MKKTVLSIICFVLCFTSVICSSLLASAESTLTGTSGIFKYSKTSDGVTITSIDSQAEGVADIPGEIDGKPVIKVSLYAVVEECSKLTCIKIPASVNEITGLQNEERNMTSLNEVIVDSANAAYESSGGALYTKGLTRLLLYPQGKAETELTLQSGVKEIDNNALINTNSLKIINLPETMEELNVVYPDSLTQINIDSNNSKYSSIDGVVYEKSTASLMYMPRKSEIKEFTVPDDVSGMYPEAFKGCKNLETFYSDEKLAEIEMNAFTDCISLKEVYLNSIKRIGEYAFTGCDALEKVELNKDVEYISGNSFDYDSGNLAFYMDGKLSGKGTVYSVNNGKLIKTSYEKYKVTFLVDGEAVSEYELEYGSEITDIPDDPEKAGYTFNGWTPDIPDTMPNAPITFTAELEPITYYASFAVDGKEIEKVPFTVESESIAAPEVPAKEGYTGKWSEYTLAASDITANAEYTINEYTVSFVADDKPVKSETVEYGSKIVIPDNPEKEGYTFREWLPKVPETVPAKDMSFYAVFEKIQDPIVKTSISINKYVNVRTVDYKTTITFTALTDSMPEGATNVWYINGQKSREGEKFTINEARESFTVQAKIVDKSGNTLDSTDTELVKVKTDFFSKIIAFFRMLFGKLPVIEQ